MTHSNYAFGMEDAVKDVVVEQAAPGIIIVDDHPLDSKIDQHYINGYIDALLTVATAGPPELAGAAVRMLAVPGIFLLAQKRHTELKLLDVSAKLDTLI